MTGERTSVSPARRRQRIAELVAHRGRQSVEALADAFGVSAETIRRDLGRLASEGLVRKVHGGALQPRLHAEGSFADRMAEDAAAKHAIGATLASVVRPGDTLFMDTGSTTLVAARAVAATPDLTVITNSHAVASAVGGAPGGRAFLVGGRYHAGNGETVGALAIEQIGRFEADHAVLTVAAIDADAGAMDADVEEAQVARAMIAHARHTIILSAASKFGRRAGFNVCRLREIDMLICERQPPPELATVLHEASVTVLAGGADETGGAGGNSPGTDPHVARGEGAF